MTNIPDAESFGNPLNSMATEELRDAVRTLQSEQLRLRDEIVGLVASNQALAEKFGKGDAAIASERADRAWLKAEQLEHEINTLRHESNVRVAEIEATLRASMTWRVGSAVLRPFRLFRRG